MNLPCGTVLLGLSCEGGPVQPLYQRLFGDSVANDPPRYESEAYPSILVNLTGDISGLAMTNDDKKLSLNGHHVYQFADEDFTVNGIALALCGNLDGCAKTSTAGRMVRPVARTLASRLALAARTGGARGRNDIFIARRCFDNSSFFAHLSFRRWR